MRRKERLARLRQLTEDEEILGNIDCVAFDQEELAELYDRGVETIYLCEGKFKIPKSKQGLDYILVGEPEVNGLRKPQKMEQEETAAFEDSLSIPSSTVETLVSIAETLKTFSETSTSIYTFYLQKQVNNIAFHGFEMSYQGTDIHSKHDAERKAARIFESIYDQAIDFFSTCSEASLAKPISREFNQLIGNPINQLKAVLKELDEFFRENEDILGKIEDIDLEHFEEKALEIAEEKLDFYRIDGISSYMYKITYDSWDHDPPGLFGKKDWNFDGSDAVSSLADDLQQRGKQYIEYVISGYENDIIKPIIDLIEELRKIL